jgi:microcystin-dependent protein
MGTDILPGGVLEDGTLVHDADFNSLVGNATILPTAISAKTLKPDMSLGDELLINDGGTLKKVTGQQIVKVTAIPAGCMMDYAGTTEPLGWAFCYGQLLSRTTYADLFAAIGVVYGAGDGSTTFAVPDCRGRVAAGQDDMGGTSANRLIALDGDILGAVGGVELQGLTTAQMPSHTHTVSVNGSNTFPGTFSGSATVNAEKLFIVGGGLGGPGPYVVQATTFSGSCSGSTSTPVNLTSTGTAAAQGSGTTHNNLQPTIILNKIIKT